MSANALRLWLLSTAGALLASANSVRHRASPLVSSAFWLPDRPLPAPPTSMRTREMTRPALMTFCSDQDWKANCASVVGFRFLGEGKSRSGANSGMQEVSRK